MLRKNIEKSAKIDGLGFPKPSQNPLKMPSKSRSHKTCDFAWIFGGFLLVVARAEP